MRRRKYRGDSKEEWSWARFLELQQLHQPQPRASAPGSYCRDSTESNRRAPSPLRKDPSSRDALLPEFPARTGGLLLSWLQPPGKPSKQPDVLSHLRQSTTSPPI